MGNRLLTKLKCNKSRRKYKSFFIIIIFFSPGMSSELIITSQRWDFWVRKHHHIEKSSQYSTIAKILVYPWINRKGWENMSESVPAVVYNSVVHLHLKGGMIPASERKHNPTGMMKWSIKNEDPTLSGLECFS